MLEDRIYLLTKDLLMPMLITTDMIHATGGPPPSATMNPLSMATPPENKGRTFRLDAEYELRFEIPSDVTGVTLTLESGSAEMFGIELAHNRTYPLRSGLNAAVFTWHGATIILNDGGGSGNVSEIPTSTNTATETSTPSTTTTLKSTENSSSVTTPTTTTTATTSKITTPASTSTTTAAQVTSNVMAYTATNTPMPSYINAHAVLQSKREMAKIAGLPGPRAVIVGAKDCGKTTLVQTLSAYSIKANGSATIIDCDPSGSGAIGIMPGSIALSLASHIDLDVPSGILHERIMTFIMGHTSARSNSKVSEMVFNSLGESLDEILSTRTLQPFVGCIVDTCGDVDGKDGAETVIKCVKALKADVVFVLGSERLFASVKATLDNTPTETVLLNKSGGVVSRDQSSRLAMQAAKVRDYFYGVDNMYNPFSSVMDFDTVSVFKVGGTISQLPDSLLPVGAQSSFDPLKPVRLTSLHDLLHKILGVSQAEKEDDVVKAPLYGFVHVVRVNIERNTMMVLAPSPGKVPGKFFLAGDMKWIE